MYGCSDRKKKFSGLYCGNQYEVFECTGVIDISYSVESTTKDCYPGTTVLINKLGIKNQNHLDEIETMIVSVKSAEIELSFSSDADFDFEFYKDLHRLLFEDIYEWAGTVRTINISKKQTSFCSTEQIQATGENIFKYLQKANYFSDLPYDELIEELADLYNSINYLHPFREGNGRCQRLFFRLLSNKIGYSMDFDQIDPDNLMVATIQASGGVLDFLKNIFKECLKKEK